ncbi:hypothetical protein [Methylobacterium sp. ID0610]|uniref:hypothetical protein n=1 Tax=Methylobacterium carpenticola TaxID=3344827 RepID=UPI003691F62B
MVEVTNRAAGPRILWVKDEGGNPVQRTLAKGETADVTLFNPEDRILKAWVAEGQIVIGSAAAAGEGDKGDGGEGDGGGDKPKPLDDLTDDELRAFLTARGVTPGNWQRKRLLTEAEAVKDVAPEKAA